jgi:HlyD family secretion protein
MTGAVTSTERAIRRLTLLALATAALLVGVLGGLASAIRINGAVIAQGTLVVDSYVKPVQHQKGGTVGQVFVRNGDRVTAGQILVHLDDTQTKANLAIVSRRLRELAARSARLSTERNGGDAILFPALVTDADGTQAAGLMSSEQRLFDDRRASLSGRTAQLRERVRQLDQQAEGLSAQQEGKRRAIGIIGKELASLEPLLRQGVIPATRVYTLQRDEADLTGELGSLVASTAEIKGKIAETELQIIQVGDDHRSEVSEQLRQAEGDSGEYAEHKGAARRHRPSTCCPCARCRDHARRGRHADRARSRHAHARAEIVATGRRPGRSRQGGQPAVLRVQLQDNTGIEGTRCICLR